MLKLPAMVSILVLALVNIAHADQNRVDISRQAVNPQMKRQDIGTKRPFPVNGRGIVVHNHTSLKDFLRSQQGRNITLQLESGQSVTGTVRLVGNNLVHMTHLTGKSYYDSVIPIDRVVSVEFRARH